jgi:hypothetical protein
MESIALFLILIGLSGALVIATYVWLTLMEDLKPERKAPAKSVVIHETKRLDASTNGGTAAA